MSNSEQYSQLPAGIYEKLVNRETAQILEKLAPTLKSSSKHMTAEDAELIGEYVKHLFLKQFEDIEEANSKDKDIVEALTSLTNKVIAAVLEDNDPAALPPGPKILTHIYPSEINDVWQIYPDTSLNENSVFTGGTDELQLGSQLVKETHTADEIWLVVSFLRWSGLQILLDALEAATTRGAKLRVITTTYMGATEAACVERLATLPNTQIFITYDTSITRLHAKGYVFCRNSGYHTAYIGSSNLSAPALSDGFEWNIKVSAKASPNVFAKILATCQAYTHDPQFKEYTPEQKEYLKSALGEIAPYPYQEIILEKLEVERSLHNRFRNLVVAATGTGKTVIAAFDYRRFRQEHPDKAHLLFVAHREEILIQARDTFRKILGMKDFGTLLVGKHETDSFSHLFVSVQSLNSRQLWEKLGADFYDYIIIDEAHHAEAGTYQKVLQRFTPKVLLGLTATPERTDHQSILDDFDDHIAAEIRLPEAIDEGLLCPFHYFGLEDTVDLDEVKWNRGGYDATELENLYVYERAVAEKRAKHIISQLRKYVNLTKCRGLGFCVSVQHAKFMTDFFNDHGIPSRCITGDLASDKRKQYRKELERGDISIIFCVDVFNEGVDIPCVNTVLLLRPTESLIVFLQQLGRGLRFHKGKAALTVLDFVGNANKNYRFEEKFGALLRPGQNLKKQVKDGFTRVPRGCFLELEEKPMEIVLASIASGFDSRKALIRRVQQYKEEQGIYPNIAQFLEYYHLKPEEIYRFDTFDSLLRRAQGLQASHEPLAQQLNKVNRMHFPFIDSYSWLKTMADILPDLPQALKQNLTRNEQLMLGMLYTSIWSNEGIPDMQSSQAKERFAVFRESPELTKELQTLFSYMASQISTMSWPLELGKPCPLDIHCIYTRNQILAGFGYRNPKGFQEGVLTLNDLHCHVLFITTHKNEKHYTPETLYKDYAVDSQILQWQTPNRWTADSETTKRYETHKANGEQLLIFVRPEKFVLGTIAAPYTFLGPADFVSSSGSEPVTMILKLQRPIDPGFLPEISRVVV